MQRILVREDVCDGEPCVAGTEIRVAQVLALLEKGCSSEQIRAEHFPEITPADIRACVRFAQRRGERYSLAFAGGNASIYTPYQSNPWLSFGFPFLLTLFCSALLLTYIKGIQVSSAPAVPPVVLSADYVKQGDVWYAKKQYAEAEQAYLRAVAVNPADAVAFNNLGLVYWVQRRLGEAEVRYRHAIELDGHDATAHFNLGILLSEEHRFPEAEREYKRALESRPEDTGIINNLGNVYFNQHRYDDAIRMYEQVLQISPSNKMAQDNLLDAQRARNRPNQEHE